jgi:hypothetical protein
MGRPCLRIDGDQVGAHGADVNAEIGVQLLVSRHRDRAHAVAQQQHPFHGERVTAGEGLLASVLPELVDAFEGALAQLGGFENGRAQRSQPAVILGDEQVRLAELKGFAHGVAHTLVERHAADESDRWDYVPALDDRGLEIARDGVAQPAQDLVGGVALLLGVDHVGLGEDGAAPRNACGATGLAGSGTDFLDSIKKTRSLLVDK